MSYDPEGARHIRRDADQLPKVDTVAWCERHEQVVRWDNGAVGHGLPPAPSPDDDVAGPWVRDCPGPYSTLRVDHGTAPGDSSQP